MELTHYGSHRHTECGLNDTDRTLKDSDLLTLRPVDVTCPTCRGWLPLVAPVEKSEGNSAKSEGNSPPKCDQCDEMRACFEVLYGTLVDFNERKQEFFCKVCRYRDPLGPDGNKLHDDNCPLLEMAKACEVKP
jgi:hypothetical protein